MKQFYETYAENDIFTFCALIDRDKVYDDNYMKKYDWEFATDSFGKDNLELLDGEIQKSYFFMMEQCMKGLSI